jgi:hypothetical protein
VELGLRKPGAVATIHLTTLTTGLAGLLLYQVEGWYAAGLVCGLIVCVLAVIAILKRQDVKHEIDHDHSSLCPPISTDCSGVVNDIGSGGTRCAGSWLALVSGLFFIRWWQPTEGPRSVTRCHCRGLVHRSGPRRVVGVSRDTWRFRWDGLQWAVCLLAAGHILFRADHRRDIPVIAVPLST